MMKIAAAVGVSKATVSLALRDDSRIRPEVRARVQEAARRVGYRPNPLIAVHMAHLRSSQPLQWRATLGFLSHFPEAQWVNNKSSPAALAYAGAVERARALGYSLEIFWLKEEGMTARSMTRILASRGVPGVVVAPWPRPGLGGSIDLDWSQFASATVGYTLSEPNIHRACHDNYSTMGHGIDELMNRGYRRIGFASGLVDNERVNHQWLARILAFQATRPKSERVSPLLAEDWNQPTFTRWVKREKPDVVITTRAEDVLQWSAKAGISVPDDMGVLTVCWRQNEMQCSGFYQNFEQLGSAAIDLLVGQLHRNERGLPTTPKVMLLPGEWREGGTLMPSRIVAPAAMAVA